MSFFRRTPTMPTVEQALAGRADEMPVPATHFVNGHPLRPPFPEGLETAVFGLGCFWGAERDFWQTDGVFTTAVGYAGGFTPNPTYQEVCSGQTGHTEVVLVVFDPAVVSYEELLKVFWEHHDPTQGMRQGNDVGTQYRSAIYTYSDAQQEAAEASRDALPGRVARRALRRHHHRDPPRPDLLLRRGLPPAVPGEEPGWLLRPRRHRRELPRRRGRGRLSGGAAQPSDHPSPTVGSPRCPGRSERRRRSG